MKNKRSTEFIEPIRLRGEPKKKEEKKVLLSWKPLCLMGLIVFFIFGLFLFWKNWSNAPSLDQENTATNAQREIPAPEEPVSPKLPTLPEPLIEIDSASREGALAARAEYDYRKGEWDQKKAVEWSLGAYSNALHLAGEAEQDFERSDFSKASNAFIKATAQLNLLEAEKEKAKEKLITKGRIALEKGEGEKATHSFELVLILDPGHEFAALALKRAKVANRVFELIASGKTHDEKQEWSLALIDFQEAINLDPEAVDARTALNRIKRKMAAEEFQYMMSRGLRALAQGELETAEKLLKRAQNFSPESMEVKDALSQVENALRIRKLKEMRTRAEALEKKDAWVEALKQYNSMLSEDHTIAFAREGKKRCVQQIELLRASKKIIENPEQLLKKSHFQHATQLLLEYKTLKLESKSLKTSMITLEGLLRAFNTPVSVTLHSDGKTTIKIYKIDAFGTMIQKNIFLKPGIYTVVGERVGYRDVRKQVRIKPDTSNVTVRIVCEEKI